MFWNFIENSEFSSFFYDKSGRGSQNPFIPLQNSVKKPLQTTPTLIIILTSIVTFPVRIECKLNTLITELQLSRIIEPAQHQVNSLNSEIIQLDWVSGQIY